MKQAMVVTTHSCPNNMQETGGKCCTGFECSSNVQNIRSEKESELVATLVTYSSAVTHQIATFSYLCAAPLAIVEEAVGPINFHVITASLDVDDSGESL